MSKDKKIIIEFDQDLNGNIDYFEPVTYTSGSYNIAAGKTAFGSSQYLTYMYSMAFNRSLTDYWFSTSSAPQWVGVNLGLIKRINKLRVYTSSSNAPNAFILQGSLDGNTYVDIYTGNFTNTTGWQVFMFSPVEYQYWRVYCTTKWSSYFQLNEIELYEAFETGNQGAFTVSGNEYDYVNGNLISANYEVQSVSRTSTNKLALNINPYTRLRKPEGDITVVYNQPSGNLTGDGGAVVNFSQTFTPTGLIPVPNPSERENLSAGISGLDVHVHPVTYTGGYNKNNLSASLSSLSIVVTFVGTQNP